MDILSSSNDSHRLLRRSVPHRLGYRIEKKVHWETMWISIGSFVRSFVCLFVSPCHRGWIVQNEACLLVHAYSYYD